MQGVARILVLAILEMAATAVFVARAPAGSAGRAPAAIVPARLAALALVARTVAACSGIARAGIAHASVVRARVPRAGVDRRIRWGQRGVAALIRAAEPPRGAIAVLVASESALGDGR
jgi:hypothetical protein